MLYSCWDCRTHKLQNNNFMKVTMTSPVSGAHEVSSHLLTAVVNTALCRLVYSAKMVTRTRYGTVENEVDDGEGRSEVSILFTKHKNIIFGKILILELRSMIISSVGIVLSIISGSLFTANNFIINQFQVVVSDAVLVRCVLQAFIFTFIIYWSGDRFLPERLSTQLLTASQGIVRVL